MLRRQVAVDHRGSHVAVTQHLAHGEDVHPGHDHVAGVGRSQIVKTAVLDACPPKSCLESLPRLHIRRSNRVYEQDGPILPAGGQRAQNGPYIVRKGHLAAPVGLGLGQVKQALGEVHALLAQALELA